MWKAPLGPGFVMRTSLEQHALFPLLIAGASAQDNDLSFPLPSKIDFMGPVTPISAPSATHWWARKCNTNLVKNRGALRSGASGRSMKAPG